ncbi:tetratricopeptide repeat protein [Bordetella sp. 02P26C-1]|uniref:tetratricopeptide repeat protein n=1 Tax=Bordetella sp. 02P26C-1 TaxID=2683195 RepID=UPI001F33632A|nr:tetratricopeptide repeat protein [Bordetella sp. 02P26C-1]
MSNTAMQRSAPAQALYEGLEELPSSKRFTREQLETIYALAYAHLAQGQYGQALPLLAFLAQYGPTKRQYLYGLALSLQMLNHLDEAIGMYSLCAVLYPDAHEAVQRIAQCHVSAGRPEAARLALNDLLEEARAAGDAGLEEKVRGMMDRIEAHAGA